MVVGAMGEDGAKNVICGVQMEYCEEEELRKGLRRSRVGLRMMETERLSPPFGRDILLSPVTLASDRPESSLGFAAGQLCDCEPVTFPL